MASTDSTIPDTTMGDSAGAQGGQSFTEKAKTALKGNIPVSVLPKPAAQLGRHKLKSIPT